MKVFDIVLATIRPFGVIAPIREAWSPALAALGPLALSRHAWDRLSGPGRIRLTASETGSDATRTRLGSLDPDLVGRILRFVLTTS